MNEPGVISVPAPNAVLSPDEEKLITEDEALLTPYAGANLEGGPISNVYLSSQA